MGVGIGSQHGKESQLRLLEINRRHLENILSGTIAKWLREVVVTNIILSLLSQNQKGVFELDQFRPSNRNHHSLHTTSSLVL